MGARQEPLLGIVTTAGFDLNNPCYRVEYKIASNILDPDNVFVLEWEFVMICELEVNQTSDPIEIDGRVVAVGDLLDDINDESTWVKANPIICSYPEGVDSLRDKLAEAKVSPDKMRNFLTKHMNVWINQREAGFLDLQKWNACGNDEFDYNKLRGQSCYIGVDLSAKIDLTSVSLVFPPINGGKYKVVSHSFIPESRLTERIRKDHMPFDSWVSDGWITCTDGEVVDYNTVMEYIICKVEEYGCFCESFCVDPWAAVQLSSDLIVRGYEVIDIRQGTKTLSEPTKVFREEVYKNNVEHDNNPVLSWAFGNAIIKADQNENIMLDKQKSTERIDPAAATMNAMVRAITHDANSGYNNRGMRGFDV
jgi:phage terminase large subunit-like protein